MDGDAADVLAVELGFVGNRADDVAGLDPMHVADFDAEGFHAGFRRAMFGCGVRTRLAGFRNAFATIFGRVAERFGARRARMRRAIGARTFAAFAAFRALGAWRTLVATALAARGKFLAFAAGGGIEFATFRFRLRVEQQGLVALGEAGQRGRDFDGRYVVLAFILFDHAAEHGEVARRQRGGDAILETRDAAIVDGFHRRQIHDLDRLARGALDLAQHVAFARGDKEDGIAFATGTSGAADAVDIGFGVVGNVVVEHVAYALDIEAARGNVGGDEDIELAILQLLDGPLALRLGKVAVDCRRSEAACLQAFGKLLGGNLGAGEDDHRIEGLGFEDAGQRIELVHAADQPVALAGLRRRRRLRLDGDLDRLAQVVLRNAPDLRRHGGREQRDLAGRRGLLQHRFDIVDETHAQHLVGFVEDEASQFRQIERAALQMIDHPAWRTDNHMHTTAQAAELRAVGLAAVNRQHAKTGDVRGIALERFRHLDGQLARRRQHQRLRLALAQIEPVEDRQGERGGLAGAGLRLAEHVLAGQQMRDRRRLDGRWRLVADIGKHALQRLAEGEFLEARNDGRDLGGRI